MRVLSAARREKYSYQVEKASVHLPISDSQWLSVCLWPSRPSAHSLLLTIRFLTGLKIHNLIVIKVIPFPTNVSYNCMYLWQMNKILFPAAGWSAWLWLWMSCTDDVMFNRFCLKVAGLLEIQKKEEVCVCTHWSFLITWTIIILIMVALSGSAGWTAA